MSRVLAFDFGASTGRAILGTLEDGRLSYRQIHRFDNQPVWSQGHLCWDFPQLLEQTRKAIDLCGSVDSLAFDTWGVDYGLLDSRGELMGLPIHYRDLRTQSAPEKVFQKISPEALYQATGNQIMPINTLFQLTAEAVSGASQLLFMPDLFAWALCGSRSTDPTIASTSQLLDPKTRTWSQTAGDLLNLAPGFLPPILPSATVCGRYQGIRVVQAAGHDTQCAVAAMPCAPEETPAFLSCGTWSLLGCELDEPILTGKSQEDQLSNELGANNKINYLKNISGLWLIQEIRRNFRAQGKDYSYNDMETLARQEPPFLCFIDPDAPEFGLPGDIPEKIRSFCQKTGQPAPATDGALVRCIYESLAAKYRFALRQIQENTGRRFTCLHLLGGGVKDGFLCQMTADSLGIPVIAGPAEATALGNILLQLLALGDIPSLEAGRQLLRQQEPLTVYAPNPQQDFSSHYPQFLHILT